MISSCFVVGWLVYGVCYFPPTTSLSKAQESTTQPATTSPDELSAKEILERMASAYASCKTYRDTGEIKTVFRGKDGNHRNGMKFATAFVRPDRFRFEYKATIGSSYENRYVIWRDGEKISSWWGIKPGTQTPQSLSLALAGATGVSQGSAHTIPTLLLPTEVTGRKLTSLGDAERLKDARLGNLNCFRIRGDYGGTTTVWIDKELFLIKKIVDHQSIPNTRVTTTTLYDSVINEDVPPKLLEFRPPEDDDEDDDEAKDEDE